MVPLSKSIIVGATSSLQIRFRVVWFRQKP